MKKDINRRNFLKTVGLGSAAFTLPGIGMAQTDKLYNKKTNQLNDFSFDFLTKNNVFQGIGEISCQGISLRTGRLPMIPRILTPDAREMINFRIRDKKIRDDIVNLVFEMDVKNRDRMEWMLHETRDRRNIHDWSEPPQPARDTELKMEIKPVERKIGDRFAQGFSYQYIYNSDHYPIYKITDRGSWEINGSCKGNEFWMRNAHAKPIKHFNNTQEFYSTEWYLPGIANPNIFQFHPLQTQLQGFTFTASDEGILVTWPTEVAHVRSLFEKWRDKNEIVHIHEHCDDLKSEFKTSPVEVLWIPGETNNEQRANLYHEVREMVHESLHEQIGMKRERVSTYGIIEEWTEPDFDYYTRAGLPKLLDAGVKKVFIPNECQNAMNTYGLSNMCCNVDFKISEIVGEEKLKSFCSAAKEGGATVEMWGNTALYTITELSMHRNGYEKRMDFLPMEGSIQEVIKKSKSPWVRTPSNAFEADHYDPRFCLLNLRDQDIRDYWMKQWKHFHDNIGIEGIFLDSSYNLSSDKFHYRQWPYDGKDYPEAQQALKINDRPSEEPPKVIHSQYHAHLSWVVEMQNMGYQYCAEDLGVFGINRGSSPDLTVRIPDLHMWSESLCVFDTEKVKDAGYNPMDVFFKGLAYRMMWMLYWNIDKDRLELGIDDPYAYQLLKIFNQVSGRMYNREILPNEKGVLYENNGQQVLWAFEDFDFTMDNTGKVKSLKDNKSYRTQTIHALKNNVYTID